MQSDVIWYLFFCLIIDWYPISITDRDRALLWCSGAAWFQPTVTKVGNKVHWETVFCLSPPDNTDCFHEFLGLRIIATTRSRCSSCANKQVVLARVLGSTKICFIQVYEVYESLQYSIESSFTKTLNSCSITQVWVKKLNKKTKKEKKE